MLLNGFKFYMILNNKKIQLLNENIENYFYED